MQKIQKQTSRTVHADATGSVKPRPSTSSLRWLALGVLAIALTAGLEG